MTNTFQIARTFIVRNNNRRTAWQAGALVERVSDWDVNGFAAFTDARNPQACIHAHESEVEIPYEDEF